MNELISDSSPFLLRLLRNSMPPLPRDFPLSTAFSGVLVSSTICLLPNLLNEKNRRSLGQPSAEELQQLLCSVGHWTRKSLGDEKGNRRKPPSLHTATGRGKHLPCLSGTSALGSLRPSSIHTQKLDCCPEPKMPSSQMGEAGSEATGTLLHSGCNETTPSPFVHPVIMKISEKEKTKRDATVKSCRYRPTHAS